MQLMTFNSLLMFDIVFIFFLFLVGVTCLVYYLPPRELTPHDAPSSIISSSPVAFPSPGSGGPVVRGCASAARRISGEGGTPIILVGVRGEAEQQQTQQQETTLDRSPARRYPRVLTADSVRTEPDGPAEPPYPFARFERSDEQEVLLLDCTLEDLVALRQQMDGGGGGGGGIGNMRLSRSMAGLVGSEPCRNCCCQYQPSVDRWAVASTVSPMVPLPPTPPPPPKRSLRRATDQLPFSTMAQEEEAEQEGEDDDDEEDEDMDEEDQQLRQQQHHHHVEYVRIEIERRGPTDSKGSANVTTAGGFAGGESMSMPACCYVRAKDTDIRTCSGPIHDV